ncbi:hypothetical protein [Fodinibius sp.]|uniref:hypothetical protein n=1 Tax=Fodinibius sp. TaxID=1872440 RepID=UPI002ACD2F47|nr:hypothetical protein [Fodinibius sp.]MDZ7658023.1 hypothetical protein [Fodinibius sp.]
MSGAFLFKEEVTQAHKIACQHDDIQAIFCQKVQDIIASETATGFATQLDVEHDVGYLMGIAEEYNWSARQMVGGVADYVERAIKKDDASRQDWENKETYMRLVG